MARRSKKEAERFLAREFLRGMGYNIIQLVSHEPDILAIAQRDGRQVRLGIELTDYYLDASPLSRNGSPMCEFDNFLRQVQTNIRQRVAKRSNLWDMTGIVFFKEEVVPKGRIARELARELVGLALEKWVHSDERICVTKFSKARPLIQKHIKKIYLFGTGDFAREPWRCKPSKHVGIISKHIIKAIEKKSHKEKKYDWQNSDEHWLVICAKGHVATSSAGSQPELVGWKRRGIIDAALTSPFDRVLFWDRPWKWCKALKPECPAIKMLS